MPNYLPRVPMLYDIMGMNPQQVQAYCRVYELPTNINLELMRNNLRVLRLLVQGDTAMVTSFEAKALFDAWGIQGDHSTCPPDNINVTLIGYFAAMARRFQALGYCRTPLRVIAEMPTTRFTGLGDCDITVIMNGEMPSVSTVYGDMFKSVYDIDNNGVVDTCDYLVWGRLTGIPSSFPPDNTAMLKTVYDTNGDGVVDLAAVATSVSWAGITGKPTTFPPDASAEKLVNKGQANGYASLDATGKVPSTQLPALSGGGDMYRSIYDTDLNGVVDTCDSLDYGKLTNVPAPVPGPPGPTGPAGAAATVTVGTTTTGTPGTPAAVTNTGTSAAAVFNFTVPAGVQGVQGPQGNPGSTGGTGPPGAAATVAVGTTTTGAPGSNAAVTNTGSTSAAVLNFTIPRGDVGAQGPQGNPGAAGGTGPAGAAATVAVGTTTTGAAGTAANVTNSGSSSAAVFNFTIPQGIQGTQGAQGQQGIQGNPGATGNTGPQGVNACTTNVGSFTIPPVGQTVQVTMTDASWIVIGQMLVVSTAGGSANASGTLQVTAKTGNLVTLLNPVAGAMPIADTTKPGMVNTLSGSAGDYIGGDNACHSAVMAIPTGTILEYGGSSAPTGFLMCIGGTQLISAYPALYAVLGTTYGGDGSITFGIPDKRGRVSIGAGQGTGLTNRTLGQGTGAAWGEETHVLLLAELASHSHIQDAHNHTQNAHNHIQDAHNHTQNAHGHTDSGHSHGVMSNAAGYTSGSLGSYTSCATTAAYNVPTDARSANITNTTATNIAVTATNQTTIAVNQSATATNQNTGGGGAHNTMQPFLVTNFMIKT
jgi:microcystin-dependent protein